MDLRELAFATKTRTVRRGAGAFYRDLLANERLPPDQLDALIRRRKQAILDVALRDTAFYARHYAEHGVTPGRTPTVDDWDALPVLDRATVKAHAAELAVPGAERYRRPALTGGSTGEPLKTAHDTRVPTLALSWRMYRWWGVEPWDDLARIGRWGHGRFDTLKNDLTWWPTRQVYLDAALVTPESMRQFARDLVRTRPALIEGYVGSMLEFAEFLAAEGLSIPAPRAVATTAAPLTPPVRARLEAAFGAPVHDEYRGSEAGWMAGECSEQSGLHVFADTRLLEVVDEHGRPLPPGETGDVVVTDLMNRVLPLVRYRLGDRGSMVAGECACGVTLPRMAPPDGRSTDVLRLPGGGSMNHRLMGMFGAHPEAVRLFQIHQKADYSIAVRVVVGDGADARTHIEDAVDVLRRRVAGAVPVRVEYVDELPFSGAKTKYVISDVPAHG